ncbi:PorP/SprF family type IX secretion system membrane protein [Aquimarina intermedia]|uniref:Type IX secretion system PorP/SprF family membrane protein n=1 Tax=Aquimarina intermedia TaxID=350814 RepID=A0A5S5C9P9_9FLAO|nr:type IX secretion system membrane protein PorP/SprF [Aquimarina intermedia]TYP75060.1 type IX secretion system PorP/SprF family membrane protein [Aquimarina intermedia]
MKKYILLSITWACYTIVFAQQDPQYSQYMYNMSTVNPGYVTNMSGVISTGLLFRKQWTGVEGSPQTGNLFAHVPIRENIELSVNYVNDRIGDAIPVETHLFNIDFAYITSISDDFKLSYGLKTGLSSFKIDPSGSNVADDPAFANTSAQLELTIGAGLFLFSSNFYVGISSPNLLPNNVELGDVSVSESKTHLYGIAGYVFDFVDDVKLKPSVVIKQVVDSPLTFDISLNSLIYDRFELGVSYRYQDALVALAGFQITPNLKVGYAYDFSISELSGYNNGSHEVILLYNFDLLKFTKKYASPRFF